MRPEPIGFVGMGRRGRMCRVLGKVHLSPGVRLRRPRALPLDGGPDKDQELLRDCARQGRQDRRAPHRGVRRPLLRQGRCLRNTRPRTHLHQEQTGRQGHAAGGQEKVLDPAPRPERLHGSKGLRPKEQTLERRHKDPRQAAGSP